MHMPNEKRPSYDGHGSEADWATSQGAKRKHTEWHDSPWDGDADDVAEYCRQAVVPRTSVCAEEGSMQAQFYPLPPQLNQAVLSSLGIGGSQSRQTACGTGASAEKWRTEPLEHEHATGTRPGLMQPSYASPQYDHAMAYNDSSDSTMEEAHTPTHASTSHGPQCQSIPQLSVRYNGGTTSQLWALCPDCGAFSKVQQDAPATLCYSP